MRRLVLVVLLAGLAACATPEPQLDGAGAAAPAPAGSRALLLEREIQQVAARPGEPLWPGFDPRAVPLAVYDGARTFFFRHPSPPDGCGPIPDPPGSACALDGRHEAMTANSSAAIGGAATATVLLDRDSGRSLPDLAALAIHEAFHVVQRARHPGWIGNEADLFTYPADAPDLLALRRLETEGLRRALEARAPDEGRCWARRAIHLRDERYGKMEPAIAAYERGTELNEGLATYVELRAAGRGTVTFPHAEFGPADVRPRTYVTGPALAFLLDRFDPGWRSRFEADDRQALDAALAKALGPGEETADGAAGGCGFPDGFEPAAAAQARQDVAARAAMLAQRLAAFEARPGWRVVVEAGAEPLFPRGFDPLNVEQVAPGRVLHTRYLVLGNSAGQVEILDAQAVTDGAGAHPLFAGVKRLLVTGLAEPAVADEAGKSVVRAAGLTLRFEGAVVTRDGSSLSIRLR